MSGIFQMQSVPILNITDFYKHFDILDIILEREAFSRFAKGHLRWSGSINLHHLDVVLMMLDNDMVFQMTSPTDYWTLNGNLTKKLFKSISRYGDVPEYEKQAEIAASIFKKYSAKLEGNNSKIIMLVIACVLLADKSESCLDQINEDQLKKAYNHVNSFSDKEAYEDEDIVDLSLSGQRRLITLHPFSGTYRLPFDPSLCPSYENRMQTYMLYAEGDANLEFAKTTARESVHYSLSAGERMYCLVLGETIKHILPNSITNGENRIARKIDGIYINGQKCPGIPVDASSFAVSMIGGTPKYLYVKDGHINYANYDDLNGKQRVPEEIAVISEVCVKGNDVIVIRNDGKTWDGNRFC